MDDLFNYEPRDSQSLLQMIFKNQNCVKHSWSKFVVFLQSIFKTIIVKPIYNVIGISPYHTKNKTEDLLVTRTEIVSSYLFKVSRFHLKRGVDVTSLEPNCNILRPIFCIADLIDYQKYAYFLGYVENRFFFITVVSFIEDGSFKKIGYEFFIKILYILNRN